MHTNESDSEDKGSATQPPVVLMVDDQVIVGEAMRRLLVDEPDIVFQFCSDAREATRTAEAVKATVILQDLVMPGIDGMAMLEAYRKNPATREIPVIVLSSKEDPVIKREAFTRGANDYLVKLPDPIELIARVRAHSRSYVAQQELRVVQQKLEASNAVLRQLSTQDGLTGLVNRRHFDEVYLKEWRRCLRGAKDISIIMIDIDGFKHYNDRYGHQGGDDCLRMVAQSLKKTMMRPGDIAARYGGEEFAIVLPETDLAGAQAVANRIRESIEELAISHEDSPCSDHVTLSLGVASTLPCSTKAADATILIGVADRALYQAKRAGRNRVVVAEKLLPPPTDIAA